MIRYMFIVTELSAKKYGPISCITWKCPPHIHFWTVSFHFLYCMEIFWASNSAVLLIQFVAHMKFCLIWKKMLFRKSCSFSMRDNISTTNATHYCSTFWLLKTSVQSPFYTHTVSDFNEAHYEWHKWFRNWLPDRHAMSPNESLSNTLNLS